LSQYCSILAGQNQTKQVKSQELAATLHI
jgi:hypothetical protein